MWNKPPKSILVIKKICYTCLLQLFKEFCMYLVQASEAGAGSPVHFVPLRAHPAWQQLIFTEGVSWMWF